MTFRFTFVWMEHRCVSWRQSADVPQFSQQKSQICWLDPSNFIKILRILHDELVDIFEKQMDTRRLNLLSSSPPQNVWLEEESHLFLGDRNPLLDDLFHEDVLVWFREIYTVEFPGNEPLHYHIEDSNWGDVAWPKCTESCLAAAAQRDGQVCNRFFYYGCHDWKIWRIGIVKQWGAIFMVLFSWESKGPYPMPPFPKKQPTET